ncbi:MAG: nucleotide sugar dehydrogenase, partial [Roseibium sp.]|uniref:nucleotide sugar dehydrogenase n=1 Tax=Roseibium sp. TaxID=1936156 RepID=UPI00261E6A27
MAGESCVLSKTKWFHMQTVVLIGMGYVGLTMSVYLAKNGICVFGVDVSETIRQSVNEGKSPFFEAGFEEALADAVFSGKLSAHSGLDEIPPADVYILTLGTALSQGAPYRENFEKVLASITGHAKSDALLILRSTVHVGFTRDFVDFKVNQSRPGNPISVAFCPERTLEGVALRELEKLPQIIGAIDGVAQNKAKRFFEQVGVATICVDTPEAAEVAKLLCNSVRDLEFAIANEAALICDRVGVSFSQVVEACSREYPRFKIMRPGPVGGPCLEKDPLILAESIYADEEPSLFRLGRQKNREYVYSSVSRFVNNRSLGKSGVTVGVAGLAFKGFPATS